MESYQAPDPVEVSSFHFSQLRTLRLAKRNENVAKNCINSVASASKYGLLFVGLENGFNVLKLENILDLDEDKENKNIEENYYCKIVSSDTPVLLTLSADQKTLAVCVNRSASVVADMYDIAAFADPEDTPVPFQNVLLSGNGSRLKDFVWNPAAIDTYAFCMSDGSLSVHELSGTTLKIVASLPNASANSACWSPKGKQIVVGKTDGSFSQYKPTLQEVKSIPPPKLDEKLCVENICWVSTTQFVVLYVPEGKGVSPYLFVVSTPKGAAIAYTNFYDVCLGNSASDDQRYFLHFEPEWGILICASTDSIEVAVIGNSPNWVQWDVKEDGKALLPGKDGATHAVGMGAMYCSQRTIVISEFESYPPMPIIFFLTDNGLLVPFHMVNCTPGLESLVRPSTPIDREGERKRQGGIQNSGQDSVISTAIPQTLVAAMSSPAMQQPSAFQPPVQENKNANTFISGASSGFGFNQSVMSTKSEPQHQNIGEKSSVDLVSCPPATLHQQTVTPVAGSSTFPSSQHKKVHKASNQTFNVSTPVTSNISKPTVLQQPSSENMINKEELDKQNTYIAAIIEEVQTFEKELQVLKSSSGNFATIGTKEEMASLKTSTLNFEDFQKEMTDTMTSLNADIHDLKNALLESFVMVEEANSRERRKNDHMYLSLLRDRALCPTTAKRMKKFEQNYLYLNTQIQEVSNKIDQDWFEYLEKKKANQKSICHLSSTEAIYKTLVNNQNIIHNLRKNVENLTARATERKMENISRRKYKTQFKRSDGEELSKLADTFLQTKLTNPEEDKLPKSKKISADARNVLKNYFSTARVNTVRPTVVYSPSQSRLISKSLLYIESDQGNYHEAVQSVAAPSNARNMKFFSDSAFEIGGGDGGNIQAVRNVAASNSSLPVRNSPSPKIQSSPSVSSSGGAFYEDITPPGSPGPINYTPEALAILQQLISEGHTGEENLSVLLDAIKYKNSAQNLDMSPTHATSGDFQYAQDNSYDNSPPGGLSFESTVSNFGLKNIMNQPTSFSGVKTTTGSVFSDSVPNAQSGFFKSGEFMTKQAIKAKVEKPNLFSFSQPSTGIKASGSEASNFGITNPSIASFTSTSKPQSNSNNVITTSSSVLGTISNQNKQTVAFATDKIQMEVPPNKSVTAATSFFPPQNKTLSFFDQQSKANSAVLPDHNKKSEELPTLTFFRPQASVSQSDEKVFSIASFNSDSIPPSLTFSIPTQQTAASLSEKVQSPISSPENAQVSSVKVTSAVSSPALIATTSNNSFDAKTSSTFSFSKPSLTSKSAVTAAPSLLFSQLTSSKPETLSVTSSSTSLFGQVISSESKPTSTTVTSASSFFGHVTASESTPIKGTTSFLFGTPSTPTQQHNIETPLPEISKSAASPSPVSQASTLTSSADEASAEPNLVTEHSSSTQTPTLPTTATSNTNSSTAAVIVPISDLPASDLSTAITTTSSFSSAPIITSSQSLFGSSVQSSIDNPPLTNTPGSTVSTPFGQNSNNAPFFSSPPVTQSFFGTTDNSQPTFFGKTTAETTAATQSSFFGKTATESTATTQPSFFGKASLETASTTPSFFGKTTSETPVFGQGTFSQVAPFGSSSATSTPAAGSFFSPPSPGQSVFGTTTANTSENPGFANQTGSSFTFGKSPFGQTQGSFGLAKSVFGGPTSTFGQPASPPTNSGFGQSTGASGFGQGSFFSGLGGKPSDENASKNVFAMGNLGKQNTESNVFGSSGGSTFGAKTGGFSGGNFSSGGGSVAQSGFGAFQQSPQKPGGFGTAPSFGGTPSFGSSPAFGSPPSFGSGNALGSVFGASQQSSNFSNFASANSPTFGSLASQTPVFGSTQPQSGFGQQQSAFGSTPVFGGGSTFGGQAPSFGSPSGGQSNTSAFTQWRN